MINFSKNKQSQPNDSTASQIVVDGVAVPPSRLRLAHVTGHKSLLIFGIVAAVFVATLGLLYALHISPMSTPSSSAGSHLASKSSVGIQSGDKSPAASTDQPKTDQNKTTQASTSHSTSTSGTGGISSGGSTGSSSGSCSGAAHHVAGGPDGTGSCWPGPSNTGVPAGTSLTNYTGPCSITVANTVITAKTVNCDLDIKAANVTIKNSKVNGIVILDTDLSGSSAWSFTLQDSEVDGGAQQIAAVSAGNMTVVRSNIHGGQTAVQCEEKSVSCVVQDSYLHGQYLPDNQPWHLGGFLSDGGQNMTLRHNYVVCDHAVNSLDEGCTGDINLIPNFAAINGALIEHNLFGANTDLSFCTYGGEKSSSPTPHSYNVVYKDNVFQRGSNGKCGAYGAVNAFEISNSGNQWTNNKWDDGGTVAPEN